MENVFDVLKERGFIAQATHEDEIRELLGKEKVVFYTGYDPTADSLHVGHFLQAVAMRHLQLAGHTPIVLIGGGTTMIGDPSGRTDMRQMITPETIKENGERFKAQLGRFIDFTADNAIMANNADWLMNLEYIPFLREIGMHFSVNRMLTAECFKSRMEKGLSFLEFNYMIMQAYDFLELNRRHGCVMQLGGDDQWSNIIAGTDLIRRKEGKQAYGMTFNLLTTSDGKKMGKTMAGAVWLDREKTTPYEFFQYWRNIEDASVEKCLALLTFLPMDEVRRLGTLEGSEINHAKEVLAYEVTKLVHSKEDADAAMEAARALFTNNNASANAPTTGFELARLESGIAILDVLKETGLVPSSSEARRLISQGGISVNDIKVEAIDFNVTADMLNDGVLMIKKGKKTYHQVKAI
ncbi:Tyrosyl-tRNA synthetase 1 (Tyrosine--tRNA ligase 1) (TyrRS 1) [Acetoanaerobium sticklandii]|uniref:Tyrosine--tRNA ligase n=1 Tax=Acetoanaerobium sticklandii (strain ATCC 12662 / DSM 519 / JCM 1433 / CCUG 9281 / NCIMB 10654 / HF) TaxID=499177 RepID=E3PUR2_ACESD|nr:tyrosine--tRNA ligase [Acetoanaerobium sticklandii]CBH20392.1 Tyrosyl-tRNA synthetase 1 (Tyrosine--tRNA ligase 1) (TyrRS 1) [Acetoanaerobium sticklandii]